MITTKGARQRLRRLTCAADSRVIGFLVSDQDDDPWPQVASSGTELLNYGPSPAVVYSITDPNGAVLSYDVTGQQWDNDLVFAVELLAAADGASCDCASCSCSGSYVPYCLGPANEADVDSLILSTSPFSYYLMDSNGGVDAIGNGHTALAIGTVTYGSRRSRPTALPRRATRPAGSRSSSGRGYVQSGDSVGGGPRDASRRTTP